MEKKVPSTLSDKRAHALHEKEGEAKTTGLKGERELL